MILKVLAVMGDQYQLNQEAKITFFLNHTSSLLVWLEMNRMAR